jgi:hypothetical protein
MKPMKVLFSLLILVGLAVGIGLTISLLAPMGIRFNTGVNETSTNSNSATYAGRPPVAVEMTYATVSFDEMIARADIILAGQVTKIGETKWNQDSGAYWEQSIKDDNGETIVHALPYYEVMLTPEQIIIDSLGIKGDQLVITVIGTSPSDYQTAIHENSLKSGDNIITFVRKAEIAWWAGEVTFNKETNSFESGKKPVLLFMGSPDSSYLLRRPDGLYRFVARQDEPGPLSLGELTKLVQEKRNVSRGFGHWWREFSVVR